MKIVFSLAVAFGLVLASIEAASLKSASSQWNKLLRRGGPGGPDGEGGESSSNDDELPGLDEHIATIDFVCGEGHRMIELLKSVGLTKEEAEAKVAELFPVAHQICSWFDGLKQQIDDHNLSEAQEDAFHASVFSDENITHRFGCVSLTLIEIYLGHVHGELDEEAKAGIEYFKGLCSAAFGDLSSLLSGLSTAVESHIAGASSQKRGSNATPAELSALIRRLEKLLQK